MKFISKCDECARLWREYSMSTTEHIKLESKLQVAALSGDTENLPELSLMVEQAGEKRVGDREAIRQHEQAAHPQQSQAAEA
jgi:hypothetical protein